MLNVSFQTSITAVTQIFAMGAVGYYLVRQGAIQEQGLKLLSFLSINIFFPFFIFYQIVTHFKPAEMPFWWAFPLINIALTLTALTITSLVLSRTKGDLKNESLAGSSLHNAGYIPLLMAMSLPLGALAGQVYASVIISVIGFDLCLWSVGVWLLTRDKNPHMDLRNLLNPPLLSMATAITIVLIFGHSILPQQVIKPIKIIGDGAMGVAMLVIGGNLAMANLSRVVWPRVGGVIMIKLLLLPLMTLVVLSYFKINPLIGFVAIIQASMPTAVSLSIIGRHYETKNQDFLSQVIFFSHLLCMLTIPIFLGIYGRLMN